MERWRKPPNILDVDLDPRRIEITMDGRVFADVRFTVDTETHERIREGRICVHCLEPLEEANPDQCPLCGFEVRRYQQEWIAANYLGGEIIGSKVRISDELERLREEGA